MSAKNSQDNGHHRTNDVSINKHQGVGKVVCVGRNYAAHAAELGNVNPERPILFIKPASSIVSINQSITSNQPIVSRYVDTPRNTSYAVHYEAELCIQLGQSLTAVSVAKIQHLPNLISGVALGLDLTLRDLQSELKQKGHPWERAKCFDGSCVLTDWIDADGYGDFSEVAYQLYLNDKLTQDGHTKDMLFPIYELLSDISYAFSLQAGDVIMTGTPSGVGTLNPNDKVLLKLGDHHWQVAVV